MVSPDYFHVPGILGYRLDDAVNPEAIAPDGYSPLSG